MASIKMFFGGNSQKAFERDGWECQECGLSSRTIYYAIQ